MSNQSYLLSNSSRFEVVKEDIKPTLNKGIPHFVGGSHRSIMRLKELKHDPIGDLVALRNELLSELEYQKKRRSGAIVELSASTGKPLAYRMEMHYQLFDKLLNTNKELLRYAYGRVPEIETSNNESFGLIVNIE